MKRNHEDKPNGLPPELARLAEQQPTGEPERIGSLLPEVLGLHGIKALPTLYNGIQYRSRLEARWAVFYTTLGLHFDYEPEGFDLGSGMWYLPDFWFPELQFYIEIKPEPPNSFEDQKARELAVQSSRIVYLFSTAIVSIPVNAEYDSDWVPTANFYSSQCSDYGYSWCECPLCGAFGIQFEGRAARIQCGCDKPGDRCENKTSDRLLMAYRTARAERFIR